ncbi:DnaJ family domain-containing protein [Histidinibacterium aquaticum]|nr:DnaJ family domain-containing protein [Histidinibacterium aquaticum]
MSSFFDRIVEAQLRKAEAEGVMDDLTGKGKPLDLSKPGANPFKKTFAEAEVELPITRLAREIGEAREALRSETDPDERRVIQKRIADLELRRSLEIEGMRRG